MNNKDYGIRSQGHQLDHSPKNRSPKLANPRDSHYDDSALKAIEELASLSKLYQVDEE